MRSVKTHSRSFTKTMTIWIVLLSVLPLFGFGAFALFSLQHLVRNNLETRSIESIQASQSIIQSNITLYETQLESFASNDTVVALSQQDTLSSEDRTFLRKEMYTLLGNKSDLITIHLIQTNGDFAYSSGYMPNEYDINRFSHWGIFRYVSDPDYDPLYLNAYRSDFGYLNSMSLIKSVYDGNQNVIALAVIDISAEYIESLVATQKTTSYGFIQYIIASTNGYVIYNDSQFLNSGSVIGMPLERVNGQYVSRDASTSLDNYTVMNIDDESLGLTYYGIVPNTVFTDSTRYLGIIILSTAAISALFSGIIGFILSRKLSQPIVQLSHTMMNIRSNQLLVDFPSDRSDEIGEIQRQFKDLMNRMQEYHQQDLEKRDLVRKSEIKALQLQINPHFLNNTLDSIKWMAKLNGMESISTIVAELGVLMKSSMDTQRQIVTVKEEITFIQSYFYIQKHRYQDRFDFEISIEEAMMDHMIPKLILQPIIENALIHAIEPMLEKGIIGIVGWQDESFLYFSISDNGDGIDFDIQAYLEENTHTSIGLSNVNRRLKLSFGEQYGLQFNTKKGQGTTVYMQIPKEEKGDNPHV